MNIKRSTTIAIILLVSGGIAIAGEVYYQKQKEIIQNEIQSIEKQPSHQLIADDETKGWKTYRNEKYGFEFRYPSHFTLEAINRNDSSSDYSLKNNGQVYANFTVDIDTEGFLKAASITKGGTLYTILKQSIEDYVVQRAKLSCMATGGGTQAICIDVVSVDIIRDDDEISGIKIYKIYLKQRFNSAIFDDMGENITGWLTEDMIKGPIYIIVSWSQNGNLISIYCEPEFYDANKKEIVNIFDEIFSTFNLYK